MTQEATSPIGDQRGGLLRVGAAALLCAHCNGSNPADRKFCASCGQPLWQSCIQCEALCAAGETFCGSCGVNLDAALEQRRKQIVSALSEAEQLAAQHRYEEAAKCLATLPAITDERLADLADQLGTLRAALDEQREEALARAARAAQAAELCLMTRDYTGALEALEQIPPPLREEEIRGLMKELRTYVWEIETLESELRAAVPGAGPPDAVVLLGKVERLLDLKPEDAQALQWEGTLEALQQRHHESERERLCRAAKEHVDRFEYDEAVRLLRQIAPTVRDADLEKQIDVLAELAWLKWDLCNAPVIDATLLGVGQRLLKLKRDDRQAAQHMATMQVKAQAPPPDVRLAAPRWVKPPEHTPLGYAIDWVGGFRRIVGEPLQSEVMRAHPGCFYVAAGLALQGLELAPLHLNLLPQGRGGLLGRMTAALRKTGADSAWGLDLSSSGLKAMRLGVAKTGQVVCDDCDYIEHETSLTRPEVETEWRPVVRNTLATFLSRHQLKGARVCLAVSRPRVLGRFFKIPPVDSKKKLEELVRYEISQQVPYPLEELTWDYQVFSDEEGEDALDAPRRAVLLGARRFQLEERLDLCQEMGLRVDSVQADCVALHNFFVYDHFGEGQTPGANGDALALLDIGSDTTHLVISKPQGVWFRTINRGADEFTEALIKAFRLTFDEAERLKRNPLSFRRMYQVDEALHPPREDFLQEVQRTLTSYVNTCKDQKTQISRIFAVGGGFQLHGLLRHFRIGR